MFSIQHILEQERFLFYDMVPRYLLELAPHSPEAEAWATGGTPDEAEFPLGKAGSHQWWAQVDHHTIGFAQVLLVGDGRSHPCASIRDFYIEPAWRRQGYGQAFVAELSSWMKGEGVCRIDLAVRGDTPGAYAFWKAVGVQVDSYRMSQEL